MSGRLINLVGSHKEAVVAGLLGGLVGGVYFAISSGNSLAALVGIPLGAFSFLVGHRYAVRNRSVFEEAAARPDRPGFKWRRQVGIILLPVGMLAGFVIAVCWKGGVVNGLVWGIPTGFVFAWLLVMTLWRFGGPGDPKLKDQG